MREGLGDAGGMRRGGGGRRGEKERTQAVE